VVTHQLQVERRTAKAHRPKTDALPLDHVTNWWTYDLRPLRLGEENTKKKIDRNHRVKI